MTKPAKLADLVNALESLNDEVKAYFDRQTGKVEHIMTDEFSHVEDGEDDADLPEWQRNGVQMARAIEADDGERFVRLPDAFDVHEWDIMRRFAESATGRAGDTLKGAIHGGGAFRRFKDAVHRNGLAEQWYKFRDEALAEVVREWCEENEIELEGEPAGGKATAASAAPSAATRIRYGDADEDLRRRLVKKLNVPGRHRLGESTIHLTDGFTIVAWAGEEPVGVISVCWRDLPEPLTDAQEAYIDLIDVDSEHQRRGIATRLLEIATERARGQQVYQLRAWSSLDRTAALHFWRSQGFALCPAETGTRQGQTVRGYYAAMPVS